MINLALRQRFAIEHFPHCRYARRTTSCGGHIMPHDPSGEDHPELTGRHARTGLWLFAIYVLLYGAFVALNAFNPALMATPWLGGVNLAIGYGVGLIAGAIVVALIYMILCSKAADAHAAKHGQSPEDQR